MAWTESHTVLIRHRKVVELAAALRIRPSHAIGHLHALWHAALEQQEDGDLSAWSDEFIALASDYPGDAPQYVRLLQKHRWLDERLIHDWLDYAGRYLESKYKTSNPKRLADIKARHLNRPVAKPQSDSSLSKDSPPNSTDLTVPTVPDEDRQTDREKPRPKLEEVKTECQMRGYLEEQGEVFWHHFESSGWIDKNGQPVARWQSKLAVWMANEKGRKAERAHHSGGGHSGVSASVALVRDGKELERVEKRMSAMRAGYSDHQTWSPADKDEYAKLRSRKSELKKSLGMMV